MYSDTDSSDESDLDRVARYEAELGITPTNHSPNSGAEKSQPVGGKLHRAARRVSVARILAESLVMQGNASVIQDLSGMSAGSVGQWLMTELTNRNNVAQSQGMQSMWELYHLDASHQMTGYWPKCKINSLRAAPHLKIQNVELNSDGVQAVELMLHQEPSEEPDDQLIGLENLCLDNVFGAEGEDHIVGLSSGLTECLGLTHLDLSNNRLGVRAVGSVACAVVAHPSLTFLNLTGNRLGVSGAEAIANLLRRNTTILSVNLASCQLGFQGMNMISDALYDTNMTLISLDLSHNQARDQATAKLARMLDSNITLSHLNLCRNGISHDSAPALAAAMSANKGLTTLDISNNDFGVNGLRMLIEAIASHPKIDAFDVRFTTQGLGFGVDDMFAKRMTYCYNCSSLFNGDAYKVCDFCNTKADRKELKHIIRLK